MDPVSLSIGAVVLWSFLKRKGSSPAAAAQTVAQVDQLTAQVEAISEDPLNTALQAQGIAAANKIREALADQMRALGLTVHGVGFRATDGGRSYTLYVQNNEAATLLTNQEVTDLGLSSKYDALDRIAFEANRDGLFTYAEAAQFIQAANNLASLIQTMAEVRARRQAAPAPDPAAIWAEVLATFEAAFERAGLKVVKENLSRNSYAPFWGVGLEMYSDFSKAIGYERLKQLSDAFTAFMIWGEGPKTNAAELDTLINNLSSIWNGMVGGLQGTVASNIELAKAVTERMAKAYGDGRLSMPLSLYSAQDQKQAEMHTLAGYVYNGQVVFSPDFSQVAGKGEDGVQKTNFVSIKEVEAFLNQWGL